MGREHRRSRAPLGLAMLSKSLTLSANRMKGRIAEDSFAISQRLQGHEVKKIHKGGDFVVQKRDFFGRKVGKPTTYEVKTGDSPLTEAQKRKKRLSRNYKVVRY
jgi:hypothetical protein